jgi:hypothetical protein
MKGEKKRNIYNKQIHKHRNSVSDCQGWKVGKEVTANVYGALEGGDKNVLKLGGSVSCTTLNIPKPLHCIL